MNRKYRKTVIAGNWKMNKTPSETKEFMTQLKTIMPRGRWCDVALCVPAVCIPAAVRAMRDAEATIRDVDVAEEMMAYTKNNILVQSAQAMLAQANQVPQGVLQLLQ